MEANIKQHVLTFNKGITNLSPDLTCTDDELQDCVGLTYQDEALRPIQDVKSKAGEDIVTSKAKLLYVHELNDGTKFYIGFEQDLYVFDTDGSWVRSIQPDGFSKVYNCTAVGNTLIVNTNNGLYYYLWESSLNNYKPLGNKIPEPEVLFTLSAQTSDEAEEDITYEAKRVKRILDTNSVDNNQYRFMTSAASFAGILDNNWSMVSGATIEQLNNLVVGLYAENKNKIHKVNCFCNPFFACYALRLYDGSYTYISNPVLMLPSLSGNTYGINISYSSDNQMLMCTRYASLLCKQTTDYSDWKDIVDDVVIFVSKEVDVYDTIKNVVLKQGDISDGHDYVANLLLLDGIINNAYENLKSGIYNEETSTTKRGDFYIHVDGGSNPYAGPWKMMVSKSRDEIRTELEDISTFFLLCELGTNPITSFVNTQSKTKATVVSNLTAQESLQNVDYYSRCTLKPTLMQAYNRRLNLIGVERGFFSGFSQFMPYSANDYRDSENRVYIIEVTIKATDGDKTVKKSFSSTDIMSANMWFYYPDPRASHFKLYQQITQGNNVTILDQDLTEHTGLNGAYYFGSLPKGTEVTSTTLDYDPPTYTNADTETLQNYLLQSEVDNPFIFNASGYVRVGQGTIIGIAALTTALNQDAYKIATTIVFTTQGIWALKINDEGQYTSVAPPFSREVCVNANTITMVDNGVFFVSKKGLMLITDDGIQCVSQQLNGKNNSSDFGQFIDFAKDCIMAYDYRDSQLWLTNENYSYHWVYNMKTGTFSRKVDGRKYTSIVTDYPDTLCQASTYEVYSMLDEPNINNDSEKNKYACSFTTRPLKLDGSIILKSIRQLKHLLDPGIAIKKSSDDYKSASTPSILLKIEGTNDLKTWTTLSSLRGKPYKFFRLHYDLKNLSATDTISGLVLETQRRYTEKLI